MQFLSTRGGDRVGIDQALQRGLAADGGLYVPERFPSLAPDAFADDLDLAAVSTRLLGAFFDESVLAPALPSICAAALDFPVPLIALADRNDYLLELFHGPSGAFKDVGARFLAEALSRLRHPDQPPVTVLAATSGDTGSAVAAAFHRRPGFRVAVLFPDGRVSARQAHLLSCFGDNVESYRVAGSFDDCQAMVKAAFADRELQRRRPLTSANSISIGRLLPQMGYYALAALQYWREHASPLNFIIPTGNLGNGLAALYARRIGLPIGAIQFATNANQVLAEFLASGDYRPRANITTLANAMDVGAPSNLERLCALLPGLPQSDPTISAAAVTDTAIAARLRFFHQQQGRVICPHTATAAELLARTRAAGDQRGWCVVATAHPAKFEAVVEPLIGATVPIPPTLVPWLARPAQSIALAATADALRDRLSQGA